MVGAKAAEINLNPVGRVSETNTAEERTSLRLLLGIRRYM